MLAPAIDLIDEIKIMNFEILKAIKSQKEFKFKVEKLTFLDSSIG